MSNTLRIPVKKKYFDAIKTGEKSIEYRLYGTYWMKRLIGRSYDWIVLTCGYPKKTDKNRHLRRKFRGFTIAKIQHDEFGPVPVEVFVIFLKREKL